MLTEEDYLKAAQRLNVEVEAIKAVAEVESPKGPFLLSGRPTLLFEAHKFSAKTGHQYDQSHPKISSRTWNKRLYRGGEREWDRLQEAAALNHDAAYESASYGSFQVLGENWKDIGYESLDAFLGATKTESGQLEIFVRYIEANHLVPFLRRHDWAGFARRYNGPSFAENLYHVKIGAAYTRAMGSAYCKPDEERYV